jgi:hypothetical protein
MNKPNRYSKIIEKIKSGMLNRSELASIYKNATLAVNKNDIDAIEVLHLLNKTAPSDAYIVFMGFCPNANLKNRLDIQWKKNNNCTFEFYKSEHQMERFGSISVGDLLVLKKRQKIGETMRLYGHGRVVALVNNDKGDRELKMEWSH